MHSRYGATGLKANKRTWFNFGRWLLCGVAVALASGVLWWAFPRHIQDTRVLLNQWVGLSKLEPEFRRKVCAHRANTMARFRLAGALFECTEIDVVVDPPVAATPSVYHPPDSNYRGLSLERLLRGAALPSGMLWLDVKDLDENNWPELKSLLNYLIPAERHPNIVVETGWAGNAAEVAIREFLSDGFQVSYYLPTDQAIDCGARQSEDCNAFRTAVLKTMALGFSHLSFDARGYEFVQTIRHELPKGVRLLTWHTARTLPQTEMLDDVELYIVRFRTPLDP